jgi:hypothetical protein
VGLLSYIIVSKFADHLPLYRQNGIFAREGVDIPRATQTSWIHAYPVDSQNIGRLSRVIVATLQDVANPLYTAPRKKELVLAQRSPKRYQMRP